MRNLTWPVVALIVLVVAGGCQVAEGPDKFRPPSLEGTGLRYYWTVPLKLDTQESIERLYLLDENLYLLTNRSRLIALDALRGLPRWSYVVTDRDEEIFRPCHSPVPMTLPMRQEGKREVKTFDGLLLNTVSRVIVLDRATGQEIRNLPLRFAANTGGATNGAFFYSGSVSGLYYAINLDKGVEDWRLQGGGVITSPVVYSDDHIYLAGGDQVLYATKVVGQGKKVWAQRLEGLVVAPFHASVRGVFVPCTDGKLYAFHPTTGEKLWEPVTCRESLSSPVQVSQQVLFVQVPGDNFYAVDIDSGTVLWTMPEARRILSVIDQNGYLLDDSRNLKVVDVRRGDVEMTLSLARFELFLPNSTVPAIYLATRHGMVACIRPVAAGRLTPEMLLRTTGK